jgi:hypothetical protein
MISGEKHCKPYFSRRSIGCGIKDKPAIFGKVWKYLDWILETIKDAKPSVEPCPNQNVQPLEKSLAEKIRQRGQGIIDQTLIEPEERGEAGVESITKKSDVFDDLKESAEDVKAFDLEIDALFDIDIAHHSMTLYLTVRILIKG